MQCIAMHCWVDNYTDGVRVTLYFTVSDARKQITKRRMRVSLSNELQDAKLKWFATPLQGAEKPQQCRKAFSL